MPELTQQILKPNPLLDGNTSRRYYTIGEVAKECSVKPHVLRYWEQEFSQLKPAKRSGNRRYYQYKDIILIKKIYELLYEKGYTISGARQWISQSNKIGEENTTKPEINKSVLNEIVYDLEDILECLNS